MSSVLKGMSPRKQGNIESQTQYNPEEDKKKLEIVEENTEEDKKKKYANQTHQIKISEQLKEEINALKNITKTKFDYEVLELLIDSYNKNEFTSTERRKFRALTNDEF